MTQKKKKLYLWLSGGLGLVLVGLVLFWVLYAAPLIKLGEQSGIYIGLEANYAALKQNPNDTQALRGMAIELSKRKNFPQAVAYLEKAVALEPENTSNKYDLGIALLRAGRSGEALKIFQEVADTDGFNQKYAKHFVEKIKRNPNLWRYYPPSKTPTPR